MPARKPLTAQYTQAAQAAQPYTGEYSALAQQFLRNKNHPVFSAGQGIADVLGDVGEAYFERKAREKDASRQEKDISNYAMAQNIAMQPNMSRMDANRLMPSGGSTSMSPADTAFNTGASGNERAAAAVGQLNPRNAVSAGPDIAALAKQFGPPTFTGKLGEGEQAFIDGNQVAAGAPKPLPKPTLLAPDEEAQRIRIAAASRAPEQEPLVQIPDPNDPTKAIWVPRSQAVGKNAFQTPRDRAFKMQTYFGEDGSSQQLDSNDPKDQETIKTLNLVTASPTDTNRTAKGFLDRMVAAEKEIDATLAKNPAVMQGLKDNIAKGLPFGNAMVSDDYRQVLQKVKDWTRAKLRKESGAVISDQEALDELATYFGQYGDDEGTLGGKRTSRLEARRQLATDSGLLGRPYLRELGAAKTDDFSQEDLEHTAQVHGISVDEVKRRLTSAR